MKPTRSVANNHGERRTAKRSAHSIVGLWMLALVSVLLAEHPNQIYALVLVFCVAAIILVTLKPSNLIRLFVFASALSGVLNGIQAQFFPDTNPTALGLLWGFLVIVVPLAIVVRIGKVHLPRHYLPFAIFLAWAVLRFATSAPTRTGLRTIFIYSIPIFVGSAASIALRHAAHSSRIRIRAEDAIMGLLLFPAVIYVIMIPLGFIKLTPGGPYGIIHPRTTAIFICTFLPVSLGTWRHAESRARRVAAAGISVLAAATVLFTLSRTASLAAVAILVISRARPKKPVRFGVSLVAAVAVALSVLLTVPSFRGRFFGNESSQGFSLSNLEFSHRLVVWEAVYTSWAQNPIVGHGPGSGRRVAGRAMGQEELFPHNEYLNILHDLGIVGFLLFWGGWIHLWSLLLRRWSKTTLSGNGPAAIWTLAGVLLVVPVFVTAFTANTIHYIYIITPYYVMIESALHWGNSSGQDSRFSMQTRRMRTVTP